MGESKTFPGFHAFETMAFPAILVLGVPLANRTISSKLSLPFGPISWTIPIIDRSHHALLKKAATNQQDVSGKRRSPGPI